MLLAVTNINTVDVGCHVMSNFWMGSRAYVIFSKGVVRWKRLGTTALDCCFFAFFVFLFLSSTDIWRSTVFLNIFSKFWLVGPLQLRFRPWVKPLVTPLIRVRNWWNLKITIVTYFRPKMRGNVEKTTQRTSDSSTRHEKFIWEHHIWCHVKISEVATLESMIPNFWCSL